MDENCHEDDQLTEMINVCSETARETFNNETNSDNEIMDSNESDTVNSHNLFVEIPIKTDINFNAASDSEDSVIFSNDGEDASTSSKSTENEKSKNLLAEISEILLNLSDDEKFLECVNATNHNELIESCSQKKRTSVDMIFTYNILSILFTKLKDLKSHFEVVQANHDRLVKEKQKSEAKHLAHQIQVEALEKILDEQKQQISFLNAKLNAWEKEKSELGVKFETELNFMKKKLEAAISEKDSAVMKYVKNESEVISLKKDKESLVKKLVGLQTEQQDLIKKSKSLMNEKMSVVQLLDAKKSELTNTLKNMEKYKEELSCKDIKSRWVEKNLLEELNQSKEKNDSLNLKILELEEELSKYQSVSLFNGRSSNNDDKNEEPENDSVVAIERNVTDIEELSVKEKGHGLIAENNSLSLKIQKLEMERLEYEKNMMNLKQSAESQIQKITSLQNQLIEMETLRTSLKQMQDKIDFYHGEIERLKETNEELRQDMESCREREAELLNFTEKLTAKNVSLQSEFAALEAKKNALEVERIPKESRIVELENKIVELNEQLKHEINARTDDNARMTKLITEKTKEIDALSAQLEEQQAENQSLKHKYSSTIRELTKEVQQYRKYKQYEGDGSSGSDSILESRTSSCNSLNDQQLSKIEPDRQTLIERIVKLQKINMKYVEKIDFLEEHIAQLLAEVKKKSKVLQYYIVREQSGALSSDVMDQNKAEMTKYGGIMASIYNSKSDDTAIPLELSVEINRKLQAVLEDTLLKNITLKENIETLGKEIDRLNAMNKSKES